MPSTNNNYIAGKLTATDWKSRKMQLRNDPTDKLWADTFEEFFKARLSLRYLEPIKILQDEGTFLGEGFSIVTIQCALIEFLAATKLGKNYRFKTPRKNEYSNSSKIYKQFLCNEVPFKNWVTNETEAAEFYTNVRCALLHEARTKKGWRIWASGSVGIDLRRKLVRRDALQAGIDEYIKSFGEELITETSLQKAFIRKFDHLAKD